MDSGSSHPVHELFEIAAGNQRSPANFEEEKLLLCREAIKRRATEAGEPHHLIKPVSQSIIAHRFGL